MLKTNIKELNCINLVLKLAKILIYEFVIYEMSHLEIYYLKNAIRC